jgi:hypothetical protein
MRKKIWLSIATTVATACFAKAAQADPTPECNIGAVAGSTECGANSTATAVNSTAVGTLADATASGAQALGYDADATGSLSLAVGHQARALNTRTTAIGTSSNASGQNATAVGNFTNATGMGASAFGNGASTNGAGSLAAGVLSVAGADFTTAVGRLANASAVSSTAVGERAAAAFAGSTAIGTQATATAANQLALGGVGSSVRVGDINSSTAAQSGTVGVATVDASGILGRNTTIIPAISTLQAASVSQAGQIAAIELGQTTLAANVASLFDLRKRDRRDLRQGIAAAVAMGQAPMPSEPGRTSYVVNGAAFRGELALGGSVLHRLDSPTPLAIGVGFSFAGNKNNSFKAGVAGEF